uniref:Uncharacterized protein n=1 Tax=Mustela putorius furo TaxID=9669 RepID=M3YGN9_MUSPF
WRTALSPTAARRASWPGARAGRGRAARGPPGPPVLPGWHPLFLQCSSSPPRGTSWATSWSSSPCSGTASCGTRPLPQRSSGLSWCLCWLSWITCPAFGHLLSSCSPFRTQLCIPSPPLGSSTLTLGQHSILYLPFIIPFKP